MKRSYLLLTFIICTVLHGYGQVSLGFVNVQLQNPNIALNDTIKLGATIYNYGNQPFNDSLKFGLSHNGANIANPTIFPRPYPGPPVVHMNPGDSIRLNFIIVVTPANFIVGPTGVVIWPIANNQNILVHDSLNQPFTVTPATAINEVNNAYENAFRSVLLNGMIHLTSSLGPEMLKEVNLYSVSGQLLFKSDEALPFNIPTDNYATGVYLVQFRLTNGEQVCRRVFIPGTK